MTIKGDIENLNTPNNTVKDLLAKYGFLVVFIEVDDGVRAFVTNDLDPSGAPVLAACLEDTAAKIRQIYAATGRTQ